MIEVLGSDQFLFLRRERPRFNKECIWKRSTGTCMLTLNHREPECIGEENCPLRVEVIA